MSQVGLFKKSGTYLKDGEEKPYTNFYVRCGDALIPVQVCFFKNEEGKDPQYSGRREVLKAFAEVLPDLPDKSDKKSGAKPKSAKSDLQPVDDDSDIPF